MDFLEKLNDLMAKNHLNKSTLSKSCNIPYTTIDGWYKKGYEGLKLNTLRKLSNFFGTSLDYWASENDEFVISPASLEAQEQQLLDCFRSLNEEGQEKAMNYLTDLKDTGKYKKTAPNKMEQET